MEPKDDEDLRCTAPRCRTTLLHGDGNQWVDEKTNKVERYCWKDFQKFFAEAKDLKRREA